MGGAEVYNAIARKALNISQDYFISAAAHGLVVHAWEYVWQKAAARPSEFYFRHVS